MEFVVGFIFDIFDMILDAVLNPIFDKRLSKLKKK